MSPKLDKGSFPCAAGPQTPGNRRFEQALETGFEFVAREGSFELRRRVPGVDEALCTGITK